MSTKTRFSPTRLARNSKGLGRTLMLLALFLMGTACSKTDQTQDVNTTGKSAATTAAPTRSKPIPLHEPIVTPDPEIAFKQGDHQAVRNVANPTLTPVLPADGTGNGSAVIVAPGGGFLTLSMDTEGYMVADWLASRGIAAFVLKYRLDDTPADERAMQQMMADRIRPVVEGTGNTDTPSKPLQAKVEAVEDAQAAIRLIRAHAEEWHIDPQRVGIIGFSAGAMTALDTAFGTDESARPNFIAPIYPPMMARDVPDYAPPMFLAIAFDDILFADNKPLGLIDSWRKAKKPLEVHLYEQGGHGFGMVGSSAATQLWPQQFHAWMEDRGLLKDSRTAAKHGSWSVKTSTIGEMLDDPQARALLERHLPALVNNQFEKMMRPAPLISLQQYMRDVMTDEKLAALQADLDKLAQ